MKAVTIRIPDDLHLWLVRKSGKETARVGKQVSINTLIIKVLERGREYDRSKGLDLKY